MTQVGVPERVSRWSPEQRAAAAQRQRLMRFLLESAFFDQRTLQQQWPGKQPNPYVDARLAGYRGRPWLTSQQVKADKRWRWTPPAKAPRPPMPGVQLQQIANVLGVSREAVRQHALKPCFPHPLPLATIRRYYRPADIERYYNACGEAAVRLRSN